MSGMYTHAHPGQFHCSTAPSCSPESPFATLAFPLYRQKLSKHFRLVYQAVQEHFVFSPARPSTKSRNVPGPVLGQLCICQQCPWPLKGPAGHTSEEDSGTWTEASWPALAIPVAPGSLHQVSCEMKH